MTGTSGATAPGPVEQPAGPDTLAQAALAAPFVIGGDLFDLSNPAAGRITLSLGSAAVRDVGATPGTVAAGDDARITGAASAKMLAAALADLRAQLIAAGVPLDAPVTLLGPDGAPLLGPVDGASLVSSVGV